MGVRNDGAGGRLRYIDKQELLTRIRGREDRRVKIFKMKWEMEQGQEWKPE
jgi:hypothetical protein